MQRSVGEQGTLQSLHTNGPTHLLGDSVGLLCVCVSLLVREIIDRVLEGVCGLLNVYSTISIPAV